LPTPLSLPVWHPPTIGHPTIAGRPPTPHYLGDSGVAFRCLAALRVAHLATFKSHNRTSPDRPLPMQPRSRHSVDEVRVRRQLLHLLRQRQRSRLFRALHAAAPAAASSSSASSSAGIAVAPAIPMSASPSTATLGITASTSSRKLSCSGFGCSSGAGFVSLGAGCDAALDSS